MKELRLFIFVISLFVMNSVSAEILLKNAHYVPGSFISYTNQNMDSDSMVVVFGYNEIPSTITYRPVIHFAYGKVYLCNNDSPIISEYFGYQIPIEMCQQR